MLRIDQPVDRDASPATKKKSSAMVNGAFGPDIKSAMRGPPLVAAIPRQTPKRLPRPLQGPVRPGCCTMIRSATNPLLLGDMAATVLSQLALASLALA